MDEANGLIKRKEFENAIVLIEEILDLDPNNKIAKEKLITTKTTLSNIWYNKGIQLISVCLYSHNKIGNLWTQVSQLILI